MKAGDWLAEYLIDKGVTDVFGIPGVVVMDFLYSVDRNKPRITPHLCFHEQGGAFEACGYAQASGKLGVAYSTRGPGLTNMLTAIADAYYDSIPCMFFTAHSTLDQKPEMRVMNNQEIDTLKIVSSVTKYAVCIDGIEDFAKEIKKSYRIATSGRKGPVVLDIYSGLFAKEVEDEIEERDPSEVANSVLETAVLDVESKIRASKRPILLIGNGVRYCNAGLINEIAARFEIPVLSSRSSQDILAGAEMYYGFVGSRATRYSNFILSKTDLIISIGNRLAFPINSKSFRPIVDKVVTVRVDVDDTEFNREIPNSTNYCLDAADFINRLNSADLSYSDATAWVSVCRELKDKLDKWDRNSVIDVIMDIVSGMGDSSAVVCDVGNHSFWVTSALAYLGARNRVLYSASFGTLGSALPKAIGAYYSTGKPSICFAGDQGIQMNIQELQFVAHNRLPIVIVILNNNSSGMIMEREVAKYGNYLVHTTLESGYSQPDFKNIASAFGIDYVSIKADSFQKGEAQFAFQGSVIVEVLVDKDMELAPSLPQGNLCQDLAPFISRELYEKLNCL